MVGAAGVGKSAITINLIQGTFVDTYDPTIEDSFRKQVDINGQTVVLDIVDTAGQDEYSALQDHEYLRIGEGFVLVFDLTKKETFKDLNKHIERITRSKDCDKFCCSLVGNKCDLTESRKVSKSDAQRLARKIGATYVEASAKNGTNVEEAFFECVYSIEKTRDPKKGRKKGSDCMIL